MDFNKEEIEYILRLLECDICTINNNIKKVVDYGKDATEFKERFEFVNGIIDKLRR